MLVLSLINAIFISAEVQLSILNFFLGITSVLALAGYLLGILGAVGLILKRVLDANLRPFNTVSTYFRLLFLGAAFISGIFVWFLSGDFAFRISLFINRLITLDSGITAAFPLSLHIIMASLFVLYLPLTNMMHFVAKYFTYHQVRWDDEPLEPGGRTENQVTELLKQPVTWSAPHLNADGTKNWVDIVTEEADKNEQ